jgi:hypothetical protein
MFTVPKASWSNTIIRIQAVDEPPQIMCPKSLIDQTWKFGEMLNWLVLYINVTRLVEVSTIVKIHQTGSQWV